MASERKAESSGVPQLAASKMGVASECKHPSSGVSQPATDMTSGSKPQSSGVSEPAATKPQSGGVSQPAASKRVEKLMADVREFGQWPLRHARSKDPKLEAERLLALRVSKMKAEGCLPPAALEELQTLKAEHEASASADKSEELMAEVREFGR